MIDRYAHLRENWIVSFGSRMPGDLRDSPVLVLISKDNPLRVDREHISISEWESATGKDWYRLR
jgi:hypothetical protein